MYKYVRPSYCKLFEYYRLRPTVSIIFCRVDVCALLALRAISAKYSHAITRGRTTLQLAYPPLGLGRIASV